MSPKPPGFAWLAFVGTALVAPAATADYSTSPVATTTLAIDGIVCAQLVGWEGGDLRGTVITQPDSSGGLPTKTLGSPTSAPLVVQTAFPPAAPLADWINALSNNQVVRHTVLLTNYSAVGAAIDAFELREAMLTEVTLPAFDATSTSLGPMKLVFNAEQSRFVAPTTAALGSIAPVAKVASFALVIDGLDTTGVIRIEPLTITLHTSSASIGEARISTTTAAATEFSNLRVITNDVKASSWKTWWTDFVLNGNASETAEKTATLKLISPTGTPLNLALNLSHLGILRVSRLLTMPNSLSRDEAEFYFEGLSLSSPIASSAGASSSSDSTATSASTETLGSSETTTSPNDSTNSIRPASTALATSTAIADRTPIATEVPLRSNSTISPVLATATNPADQGSRDPAAFPRVDGLKRLSYSGTYQPTYTSEQADYTSPETIYQLVGRVDAAAKAAGWTLITLAESETTSGKSVNEGWRKPPASATIGYFESKGSSGTQLNVQVYIQIPAEN